MFLDTLNMRSREQLIQEIEQMPDDLLDEVFDFLKVLQTKHSQEKLEGSLLSESALARDWLRLEEDEAWQDLQKVIAVGRFFSLFVSQRQQDDFF